MRRLGGVIAIIVFGVNIAQAPVWGAQVGSNPTTIVTSRMTRSRTEATAGVPLDARFAREWGLKREEWARYRHLMQGPLGIWTPHLDPLTALGIEARSQAEREHYAALEVRMEGERVAKILMFQRAYDAAWKRLYPHLEPVSFAAVPPVTRRAGEVSASARLAVFIKEPCPECDATVQTLQAQGRAFDIYMVGLEDDAQLRAWAARVHLDPAKVRAGAITLNHDAGRWLSIGDEGPLPAVLADVNGQWQRE